MNHIADHGRMIVARGLTSFAFAVWLLLGTGWSSVAVLALMFGSWALVDGIGSFAFALGAGRARIATYLARGGLGVAVGALALALPATSATGLYVLVGIWAIGTGALEMAFGERGWSVVPQALGFMFIGAQSLAFGLSVVHIPLENAAVLRGLLASFAVLNGIAAYVVGLRLCATPPARPGVASV
jgi:uncharacterized membrane protein HdeD (DUF308 family)